MALPERRFPWNLDWNLLRSFMVVAEQGGITAAANMLGLKQPTVSSALKRLEAAAGHRLVERNPRHFALTEAGEVLLRESRAIFGSVQRLPDLLAEASQIVRGHVGILLASHVVSPHFDAVLAQVAADHPAISLSLSIHESTDIITMIRENRATLGICLLPQDGHGLDASLLFQERFALYCGPGHRLFGRDRVTLADLRGERSVCFQTETLTGPLRRVRLMREQAGLDIQPHAISASLHEIRRMVSAGIGIGALPEHVARPDEATGRLWRLPLRRAGAVIEVHALRNPARSLTRAETVFLAALDAMLDSVPQDQRRYFGA